MKNLFQDIAYAFRILRKSPTFVAIAILTLALGIGANTAIFSYVDAWLIKPLPYPEADRLMALVAHHKKQGWTSNGVSSTADFIDFQKQNTSFEQTAAWASWNFNLSGDGPPDLVEGGLVSWNYFDILGVRPILGRTFRPDEDSPATGHVVILGAGLWKTRYGGDPAIIGRTVTITGMPYTVVGVMPASFQFPLMGVANLWTPMALTDTLRQDRDVAWFSAFGRLKPGATLELANAECAAIFAALEKEYPQTNANITMLASPLTYEIGKNEGTEQVMICMWTVSLILLIACANVANLMLAHAGRRSREFAIRSALGASKWRMIRQLLTESLLLFFLGGLAGVLFGVWGMSWIESAIPEHIRGYLVNFGHVSLDLTTLGFTLAIALLSGLIFGIAPAFQTTRIDINGLLKDAAGQISGGLRGGRIRRVFVAGEVALAIVVLIATGLLVKSFYISVRSSPGYNPENLMTAQLQLPAAKYKLDPQVRNFTEDVLSRIRALPGVDAAGAASALPFGGFGATVQIDVVGRPAQPGETLGARYTAVSPDFFAAMQISLLRGRVINASDGPGDPVSIVINQTMARRVWPDHDPLGQKLSFGEHHIVGTVVGIVNDIKMYQLRARPERQMYVSLAQFPSHTLGFVARESANSGSIASDIRNSIWGVDSDQAVSAVEPLSILMAVSNTGDRVLTELMAFFGALAALLGAVGIFGVMSHTVAQRTHEIGIRMALGADPSKVMCSIILQGLKLTAAGIVLGVPAALAASRLLGTMLYQVKPMDLFIFISVPLSFSLVAIAACYWPARRAMRVDPIVALRYE